MRFGHSKIDMCTKRTDSKQRYALDAITVVPIGVALRVRFLSGENAPQSGEGTKL